MGTSREPNWRAPQRGDDRTVHAKAPASMQAEAAGSNPGTDDKAGRSS